MHRRQAGACAHADLCNTQIDGPNFQLDHKLPVSRGGDHTKENIQILCSDCNEEKGARTDHEYRNAGVCASFDCNEWTRPEKSLCLGCYLAELSGECSECGRGCRPEHDLCWDCYKE